MFYVSIRVWHFHGSTNPNWYLSHVRGTAIPAVSKKKMVSRVECACMKFLIKLKRIFFNNVHFIYYFKIIRITRWMKDENWIFFARIMILEIKIKLKILILIKYLIFIMILISLFNRNNIFFFLPYKLFFLFKFQNKILFSFVLYSYYYDFIIIKCRKLGKNNFKCT